MRTTTGGRVLMTPFRWKGFMSLTKSAVVHRVLQKGRVAQKALYAVIVLPRDSWSLVAEDISARQQPWIDEGSGDVKDA